MTRVTNSPVITMSDYGDRARRVSRAAAASRRGGGRLWVNGRELGGTDPRHAHLAVSFD